MIEMPISDNDLFIIIIIFSGNDLYLFMIMEFN